MIATKNGHDKVAEFLWGSDSSLYVNNDGKTACDLAKDAATKTSILKKEKEEEDEQRRRSWERSHPLTDKDWDDLCDNGCYGEEN
jgi:hypothetical protein